MAPLGALLHNYLFCKDMKQIKCVNLSLQQKMNLVDRICEKNQKNNTCIVLKLKENI